MNKYKETHLVIYGGEYGKILVVYKNENSSTIKYKILIWLTNKEIIVNEAEITIYKFEE